MYLFHLVDGLFFFSLSFRFKFTFVICLRSFDHFLVAKACLNLVVIMKENLTNEDDDDADDKKKVAISFVACRLPGASFLCYSKVEWRKFLLRKHLQK